MAKKLSIAVSIVLHPLLMPTFLFALLFYYAPDIIEPINPKAAIYLLLAVFITTFVLPMISITALRFSEIYRRGKYYALSLPGRKDRIVPFFFTSLFYMITTYMFFSKFKVNQVLVVILAASTLIILLVSLITLFLKVSTHSASAGAMIGFLLALGFKFPQSKMIWPLILILILGGLVMSARLYLHTHKPIDVLIGSIVGLSVSLSSILIFISY